jgi:hypothetical protein
MKIASPLARYEDRKNSLNPKKINAATVAYRDDQEIISEWKGKHCNIEAGLT